MLDNNEIEQLLTDFQGETVAGVNVKYDDDFIALGEEIHKLTSVEHINDIDYEKIQNLSKKVLIKKSKDINAICYLSFSLFSQSNDNITEAINILASFIDKYWQHAFPPLKRLKARVNIITWWFGKLEKHLTSSEHLHFQEDQKELLIKSLSHLDVILNDNMQEHYTFNLLSLQNIIELKSMQAKPIQALQENFKEEQISSQETQEATIKQSLSVSIKPIEKVSKESLKNANTKEIQELYQESLKNSKELLEHLFQAGTYSTDIFVINRMQIWAGVDDAPFNEAGVTMLPEPEEHKVTYLEKLHNNKEFKELLKEAENLIDQYIFWLDLHFYVAKSLDNLGKKEEQQSVEFFVNNFLKRVGNIQNFKFRDNKTPFATRKTIRWINQLNKTESQSNGENSSSSSIPSLNWCLDDFISLEKTKIKELL